MAVFGAQQQGVAHASGQDVDNDRVGVRTLGNETSLPLGLGS